MQAGVAIADDGSLVGETDGSGFGVGTAPKSAKAEPSAVVQLKKKERDRERKRTGRGRYVLVYIFSSPALIMNLRFMQDPHTALCNSFGLLR